MYGIFLIIVLVITLSSLIFLFLILFYCFFKLTSPKPCDSGLMNE